MCNDTEDLLFAAFGTHEIAIAEGASGDIGGATDRLLDSYVDLMMIRSVPEKVIAMANYARVFHGIDRNSHFVEQAFTQAKNMAKAATRADEQVAAYVALANAFAASDQGETALKHFDHALQASQQLGDNKQQDMALQHIALAEASSALPRRAKQHADAINHNYVRALTFHSMSEIYAAKGHNELARNAMHSASTFLAPGTTVSGIDE